MTSERLITLMEVLQVYAHLYLEKFNTINIFIRIIDDADGDIRKHSQCEFVVSQLKELLALCERGELPVTRKAVASALYCLTQHSAPDVNEPLKQLLGRIADRLPDELEAKLLFQVPHSRKHFFEQPLLHWEPIIKRFGALTRDVEEMSRCFALSRYTAAMFHAMQVAELGAIELGHFIEVEDPMKGWGSTQKKLSAIVQAGRNKLPQKLAGKWDFLEQMNREIDSMVLSWRHKIDHAANRLAIIPNTDFTPDIAEHIMGAVRIFMLRLQEGMPG